MKKKVSIFLLLNLILAAMCDVQAQVDTLASLRRFLKTCSDYQRLPLQVEVELVRTTNLVLSKEDTGRERVALYLGNEGSYAAMGGVEQLADDSMLLMVNQVTKRMVLMRHKADIGTRLRQMLGLQFRDSSLQRLAGRYTAAEVSTVQDTGVIDLKSRAMVYGTALSKEEIQVRYDPVVFQPYAVKVLKRSLLPVSDSIYQAAGHRSEWAGRIVTGRDSSFYLVKEQTVVFFYRKIGHLAEAGLPVRLSDRIAMDRPGRYRPVKGYADYVLTQQF